MSKFKIGDKVRIIGTFDEGVIEYITDITCDVRIQKEKKSRVWHYLKKDLELIEAAPEANIGLKYDSDKPDYTLVNKELMEAVAKGMTIGVKKYGRLNYRNFTKTDIPRFEAALLRHMFAHLSGEEIDADTNLPHLFLVGTNLNIILWLKENKNE